MSVEVPILIELLAAGRCYFVPRAHVAELDLLLPFEAPATDARGRPLVIRELAELFGAPRPHAMGRRQALSVALRRRTVALLVDRVEGIERRLSVRPLPNLLARRLADPWVLGAVVAGDAPALVLDLQRIAADVALGAV